MLLAPVQALSFTGMGGATGVYEGTDTDRCDTGGTSCAVRDSEAFYKRPGEALCVCTYACDCGLIHCENYWP